MKRILITGATGFIGRHLLKDIDFTRYHIRLITRSKVELLKNTYPNFEIVQADLNDFSLLNSACKGVNIIVNTAAEVRNHELLEKTNVGGTHNLIKVIKSQNIEKLIHLSSVGVAGYQYSNTKLVVNEDSNCSPKNEYERTKLASELLLVSAQKEFQFQLDIIRPTNVFGEEHPFNALLGLIKHTKNERPFLFSKGAQVNYVYVKDISYLIEKLLMLNESKGLINVGKALPLIDFYNMIKLELGTHNKKIQIPDFIIRLLNFMGMKQLQSVSNGIIYSDQKLNQFYNYHFGEHEGLRRTIKYYKQLNLLK